MEALAAPIHRLSVDDVFGMLAAGVLSEDDRLELVDGILLDVAPAGEAHSEAVARLGEHFVGAGPWQVRVQDTLYVPRGFVSPDLMLVRRDPSRERLTSALLVVEVSRTTRVRDEAKAEDYAQAGVPEYWRFDVEASELVVRRGPDGDRYREHRVLGREGAVEPLAGGPALELATILGPSGG